MTEAEGEGRELGVGLVLSLGVAGDLGLRVTPVGTAVKEGQ